MRTHELANRLLDTGWDGNFPVDPWEIAEHLKVNHHRLPDDGAQFRVVASRSEELTEDSQWLHYDINQNRFVIAINADENGWRQRFAVTHGMASVFLGVVPLTGETVRRHDFRDDYAHVESANRVTLATLLPERYIRHLSSTTPSMTKLSEIFGVSPTTVRVRLKQLSLL